MAKIIPFLYSLAYVELIIWNNEYYNYNRACVHAWMRQATTHSDSPITMKNG